MISLLVAITAVVVSLWFGYIQQQLQRMQIKLARYDKRYAVYLEVEEFLNYVMRVDGSIKIPGPEHRRFLYAAEQTEFLFGSDAVHYVTQLRTAVKDLYPKACKRDQLGANQPDVDLNLAVTNALIEIDRQFGEQRKNVFGPYLQLNPSRRETD